MVAISSGNDMYGRLPGHILYTETVRGYGTCGFGIGYYRAHVRKVDLNRKLLEEGLAWWNEYYSDDMTMKKLVEEAIAGKRVFWADDEPISS